MPNNKHPKEEIRRQLEGVVAELQTLRDEIRLRIHLAGMDLKDTWKDIESRVEEIEQQMPKATEKLHDAAIDVREAFRALRSKLP